MEVSFIGQPFSRTSIGSALKAAFSDPKNKQFTALVAWAKASGLGRIADDVNAFRKTRKGNFAELLVGIDEGGATFEGLTLAQNIFDEAYVFHDKGPRTFHTKIYLFKGDDTATLIIGSGNLTKGGLWTNYEAANLIKLDLDEAGDIRYLNDVLKYIAEFRNAQSCCIKLTDENMTALRAGDYNIKSEAEMNKQRSSAGNKKAKGDLFTTMKGLGSAPKSTLVTEKDDADSDKNIVVPAQIITANSPLVTTHTNWPEDQRSFYKKLSKHDASLTQAPGQIIIPIEFKTFFPPLTLQWDKINDGGSRQSEVKFPAIFKDGKYSKDLADARFVLYEPAPNQKRKNPESRFTFHDREVFKRFSEGDVILFKTESGKVVIERHTDAGNREKKYAWL
ncbi:phospholipase D family protein [Massilia oculi]|uniref:phospholipase D family protein n=1 Tax=Massilia oculi TaxID=945844 RepID=UPI0013B3AB3C|nr:phospholipase D family protein [Massilia oculi]